MNERTDYFKAYNKQRPPRAPRIANRMLTSARFRAKSRGLPCDIELSDIVVPKCCPLCDTPMFAAYGARGGSRSSPTLDKIVSSKGYVKGNVAVICKGCNSQKGDASPAQLRRIANWIEENS